jgi:hypothetical protein
LASLRVGIALIEETLRYCQIVPFDSQTAFKFSMPTRRLVRRDLRILKSMTSYQGRIVPANSYRAWNRYLQVEENKELTLFLPVICR